MAKEVISIRSNIKALERKMTDFAFRHVPEASALAVTALARQVERAERAQMSQTFDRPTPFTLRGIGSKAATVKTLASRVFMKPTTAEYLEPYEYGGKNKLGGRALNNPRRAPLNKYGNLPSTKIKAYEARSDIYIGTIVSRSGQRISGVWQRQAKKAVITGRKTGTKHGTRRGVYGGEHGRLKLLIRFTDAHPTQAIMGWHDLARSIILARQKTEMSRALRRVLVKSRGEI